MTILDYPKYQSLSHTGVPNHHLYEIRTNPEAILEDQLP